MSYDETTAQLIRENRALAERVEKLREALHAQMVDRAGDFGRCCLCERLWPLGTPESHAPDCLAAPEKP